MARPISQSRDTIIHVHLTILGTRLQSPPLRKASATGMRSAVHVGYGTPPLRKASATGMRSAVHVGYGTPPPQESERYRNESEHYRNALLTEGGQRHVTCVRPTLHVSAHGQRRWHGGPLTEGGRCHVTCVRPRSEAAVLGTSDRGRTAPHHMRPPHITCVRPRSEAAVLGTSDRGRTAPHHNMRRHEHAMHMPSICHACRHISRLLVSAACEALARG